MEGCSSLTFFLKMSLCASGFKVQFQMNRKSEEESKENVIFVKGEIQKIKLDCSGPLPRVVFHQQSLSKSKSRFGALNPVKIYSQDNSLAVIDQNNEAWLMIQQFDFPINLSELTKTTILKIYLGEKELIARTKKGNILVNWGTKKLLDKELLSKQVIAAPFNYDSLFEVFSISSYSIEDIYKYCPEPKVDNYNRLYHFDFQNSRILGYPTRDVIQVNQKIKGISVGKFHCLCWDQEGLLYSWGSKTLGLGYVSLPSEEYIEHPQPVRITRKVLSAVAASHYSLALTEDGVIYQWGVKKDVNEINEEPIFKPRPLEFKYFRCSAKFISLKGKQDNFAALSSSNQLYVWGATAKKLINDELELPHIWKGNYLFEPVLQTELVGYRIHDFSIDNGYLAVIVGSSCEPIGNQDYWNLLKVKAKKQLQGLKKIRINTQSEEVISLKKKYKNSILSCPVEKVEKKKLISDKMKSLNGSSSCENGMLEKHNSERIVIKQKFGHFKKTAPLSSATDQYWQSNSIRVHKRQVSEVPIFSTPFDKSTGQDQNNWRSSEASAGCQRVGKMVLRRQKFSEIYQLRLKDIMEKKKYLEENSVNNYLQKIAEDSVEFRLRKKEEHLHQKRATEDQKLMRQTLQKVLISQYLTSFFTGSADQARELKIKNFFRNLVLQRVERNIRNLFIAKKIQYSLKNLKQMSAGRYFTLHFCIKKYVSRFRKRRFARCRNLAVMTLVKNEIFTKIRSGLDFIKKKKCQIHKMNQWLKMYERNRKQCLKEAWNNFITITFKVKDGGQYYFSPTDPDLTFEKLWRAKLRSNPLLKLYKFMRFTTPFMSLTEIKFTSPLKQGKRRGHRMQEEKNKNGHPTEILPFSLHYNYFRRPKNFDVNVGQANRVTPYWVQAERKTLQDHFKKILFLHNRDFAFSRREYEINLACFIANNYETFYEKRWKFILEYNKVEKTHQKKKKEAELRRLLNLIGMAKLVQEDCIPQKHMVLEEALKRREVPVPPDPVLHFNLVNFEESFKLYVEDLRGKMKVGKKVY